MDNLNSKFRFNNDFFSKPIELRDYTVYQIGDLFCEYDTVIDDHLQEVPIELSFVESGAGKMYCDGVGQELTKGDIYLSLKGDTHKVASNTVDTLRFYYIAFSAAPHSPIYPIYRFLIDSFASPTNRLFHFPYVFSYMTSILSEVTYANDYHLELIESSLSQILVALYRHIKNQLPALNHYNIDSKNGIIYNITNYISNNLLSIDSVKALAEKFSYNYYHLSKKFATTMGKSMQAYLQEKRLTYSAQLLCQDSKSITETAKILNYSSINNFSRAFKNFFGISPLDYVAKYNKE